MLRGQMQHDDGKGRQNAQYVKIRDALRLCLFHT